MASGASVAYSSGVPGALQTASGTERGASVARVHVHVCAPVSRHVETILEEHKIALKVRLFIPYIPNTQETEAGGHEFHSSKGYI